MSVKVTVKLDSLEEIKAAATSPRVKRRLAEEFIPEVKKFILRGISPVFGERRYTAYKNPDKYPAGRKPKRPVNLKLSGDMLDALTFRDRAGTGFELGWFGGKQGKKAYNHNNGDTVPERRILPDKKGERFNASLTRFVRDFYIRLNSDILKRAK